MTWHTKRNEVPAGGSFLPEDYLQRKSERRSMFISLFLFFVVALGVVGAFFVTHRRWNDVRVQQERVNSEYAAETVKIEQLKVLEQQKSEVIEKAEITTAIREKVPRSILLAELINRMPDQLTLSEMELKSKRLVEAPKAPPKNALAGPQNQVANRGQAAPAQSGAPAEAPRPTPPRFEFTIALTGLASIDEEIADYVTALNNCPLLSKVEMISTTEVTVDEVQLRKFNIEAVIRPGADARSITPLHVPRLSSGKPASPRAPRDPMDPTVPRDDFETKPTAGVPAGKE